MATIKSFTDVSQSRVLAEILPLESADMLILNSIGESGNIDGTNCTTILKENLNPLAEVPEILPCWSLASLLDSIPKHIKNYNVLRIDISENDFAIWYDEVGYGVNNDLPNITMKSAVDACYELIIRLNELKML